MQYIISGGICQIAVPGFFLISGYLYFLGTEFTIEKYKDKTLKRFRTLFIPFVSTAVIIYLLFLSFQQLSFTSKFVNNRIDLHKPILAIIYSIFSSSPSYQLWFIKDLMIICLLLTPIIYWIVKLRNVYVIGFIVLIWLLFSRQIANNFCPAITFFTLGAYLSYSKFKIHLIITRAKTLLILSVWIVLLIINYFISWPTDILANIAILLGLVSVWVVYDDFKLDTLEYLTKVFSLSFFLYLFHEPFLTLIIKFIFSKLGINNFASFWAYIIAPLVTIPIILFSGYLLKRYSKSFYNIITGNR